MNDSDGTSMSAHQGPKKKLICDWWFNFDCSEAEALAEEVNGALAAEREAASGDDQGAYEAPVADYSAGGGAQAGYEAAERAARRLGGAGRRNNRRGGQRSGRRG